MKGNSATKSEHTVCMTLERVCNSSLSGKRTGGTGKLGEPRKSGKMNETMMGGQRKRFGTMMGGQRKRFGTNLLC